MFLANCPHICKHNTAILSNATISIQDTLGLSPSTSHTLIIKKDKYEVAHSVAFLNRVSRAFIHMINSDLFAI